MTSLDKFIWKIMKSRVWKFQIFYQNRWKKRILQNVTFIIKLKVIKSFWKKNKWFIGVKSSNTPATCSGCLKKGVIKYGNLHLYTKGILYLHKHEKVVETTLRFCLSKFCVANITSTLNNIQLLADDIVYKDLNLILWREQRAEVQVEGFSMELL